MKAIENLFSNCRRIFRSLVWQIGLSSIALAAAGNALAVSRPPGETETFSIENPIAANSFPKLLELILNIIIDVGLPIIVISIIFVGFKYVTAQGKPAEIAKAHQAFTWVMVGTAIVIGARVIVAIVTNTVSQIK
jgi:hypothetical protein